MQANSRVVDAVSPVAGIIGAPYPQLVGEDLLTLINRYHNLANPTLNIGTKIRMSNGDEFAYLKMTGGAASLGMLVHAMAATAQDTVSSSADLQSIETVTGLTAGDHVGDEVLIDDGTGEGQTRWIVANAADSIRLDRPLLTALAVADSDITIYRPYRVKAMALAAEASQGLPSAVAIGAVTENYYGWFQVGGMCQHVLQTAALAAGTFLTGDVTGGAAGTAKAMAAGSEHLVFGYSIGDGSNIAADTGTIPVKLFTGKLL